MTEIEIIPDASAEAGEDQETVRSRFDDLLGNLSDDQVLRIHIFDGMGCAEIDGKILIENMDMVYDWIMDKSVPHRTRPRIVRHAGDGS